MSDASSISPGSVSRLLGGLRDGNEEAVTRRRDTPRQRTWPATCGNIWFKLRNT
jgi:hypothetical protein